MKTLDSYPDDIKKKLEYFLQNSDLYRMNRTIRTLFFAYLRDSKEGFSIDFIEVLLDVETLMTFLEEVNSV